MNKPGPDAAHLHVTGQSRFLDDLPHPPDTLHAAPLPAPFAHGHILAIDPTPALRLPGVRAVMTAADVPGENRIGVQADDEPLLAETEFRYSGETLALVVADDPETARAGTVAVGLDLEPLPAALDPLAAKAAGALFEPPRSFVFGDLEQAWGECVASVAGRVLVGGQEHLYLETQAALAIPRDDGGVLLHAATQSPSAAQSATARVLGLQMHQIEVDVLRLGGGFGGKESQATRFAVLAALAAHRLGRPVKLVLRRDEDMAQTGKRHPYCADYRIGLNRDGRIHAYAVDFYQNAGAYTDLSPAVLARTLFHAGNAYAIPHFRATAWCCRTHLPPFTAMRGFGAPQGVFVLECAIDRLARQCSIPAETIRARSLLAEGDRFPFGMQAERCRARPCWERAQEGYDLVGWRQEVDAFNAAHRLEKKGLVCLPIAFGISFTHIPLNQGEALVHLYRDGSVGLSAGAVEMGQGVNRKLQRVAAHNLGLPEELIRVESTNTTRTANLSASAASVTADLHGHAVRIACETLRERLLVLAAELLDEPPDALRLAGGAALAGESSPRIPWVELLAAAYERRIGLSAQAHYAIPGLFFDTERERGHPFAYHVYGAAICEATLDGLRGTYRIDRVAVVHDVGRSLAPDVDRGQVEGGIVQGIGWLTSEELRFDDQGRLLTRSMATYKPPDIHAAPEILVEFLEDAPEPAGLLEAKAVGEPPFLYGIAAWLAVLEAMRALRPDRDFRLAAPLTPERVLMALYGEGE
jgi:xanthine dehydrogenase large subunit